MISQDQIQPRIDQLQIIGDSCHKNNPNTKEERDFQNMMKTEETWLLFPSVERSEHLELGDTSYSIDSLMLIKFP